MEIPCEVMIHNELLGLKGSKGRLLQIGEEGFYEVNLTFGANEHRVLLPVGSTVVISQDPEAHYDGSFEIER